MPIDTQQNRTTILKRLSENNSDDSSKHLIPSSEVADLSQTRLLHNKSANELQELFCRVLEAHNAKTFFIPTLADLPKAIADHLVKSSIPPEIYSGNNQSLKSLAWIDSGIQWQEGEIKSDGLAALAEAECAIADTGTVVVLSGEKNPTRNNFLAEHHIVLLHSKMIKAYSEDVWSHLKQTYETLPRAVNFISGPSSSADVGLKLEYGAHGPRSLAIFILADS